MSQDKSAPAAIYDFALIRSHARQLRGESDHLCRHEAPTPASATGPGKQDPAGVDVVCRQPCPENYGIIDGGADHIGTVRSTGATQL